VNELVGHHFTRTLVNVALDHVEAEGSEAERQAIEDRADADGAGDAVPAGPDHDRVPAARR
jgi:hypothetical protein